MQNGQFNETLSELKKDPDIFDNVLRHFGYSLEKIRRVKGVESAIYKLPEQKTGSLFASRASDGTILFKDYGPYVPRGGSVIDFILSVRNLPSSPEGVKAAIDEIKQICNISAMQDKSLNTNSQIHFAKNINKKLSDLASATIKKEEQSSLNVSIAKKSIHFKMDSIKEYYPYIYNYLQQRGIEKIKRLEIYRVLMSYSNKETGETKEWNKYMIGIPYGVDSFFISKENFNKISPAGVELRDTKINSKYKTYSYTNSGYQKSPTLFISAKRKALYIFESMIDYFTLQSEINHNMVDIAILNGSGMGVSFAERFIPVLGDMDKKRNKNYDEIVLMGQNDQAWKIAAIDILPSLSKYYPLSTYKTLTYKKNESGYDINDLRTKVKLSSSRILTERIRYINNFNKLVEKIETLKEDGYSGINILEALNEKSPETLKSALKLK